MIMRVSLLGTAFLLLSGLLFTARSQDEGQGMPAPPPARQIPGITAEDRYPHGCVDCHINYVQMNLDTRLSTLMKQWKEQVEPKLLATAQASAPEGITLKGKHPDVPDALRDIPAGCITCHSKGSTVAPAFANLLHRIHLVGGDQNHFLTLFQGECTHCHKLDQSTGHWAIRSAPEP